MLFFNVLGHKYTEEKINLALAKWVAYSKNEPANFSIESRLMSPRSTSLRQTSIFVYRKYPLYTKLTFPSHYYLTIDDKIWHPGFADDLNIFQTETSPTEEERSNYSIIEIKEKCNYCSYWEMHRNFEADKHFNLMANNCQVVVGMFAETICIILLSVALIASVITGYYLFLIFALFLFFVLFFFSFATHCTDKVPFSTCPHIIPLRKY